MLDRSGSSRQSWGDENPPRRLSVVTHHDNNGLNSGLPSILRAAAGESL